MAEERWKRVEYRERPLLDGATKYGGTLLGTTDNLGLTSYSDSGRKQDFTFGKGSIQKATRR